MTSTASTRPSRTSPRRPIRLRRAFYTRPARFIRIEKAVEIPDKTVRKINGSAFGPAGMGMREILGYAPVQPDGSVQIQVPANVPFTIDVLDANARRITSQHTSWLQLLPGETKSCNGCHTVNATDPTSHGRSGFDPAGQSGRDHDGLSRFRAPMPLCSRMPGRPWRKPWRASAARRAAPYRARRSWPRTSSTRMSGPPASRCPRAMSTRPSRMCTKARAASPARRRPTRVVPHLAGLRNAASRSITRMRSSNPIGLYIQNLWNSASRVATVNGVANTSVTCTNCHNTVSLKNAIQVPAGQIDLTGGASSVDTTVVTSYENVLFPHDEQTLNMGVLEDVTVTTARTAAGSSTGAAGRADGGRKRGCLDGVLADVRWQFS